MARTLTVNWGTKYQTIDGFGAASAGNVPRLSSDLMNLFFTKAGLNLTFIRLQIYPDYSDCVTDQIFSTCVPSTGATLSTDDLDNARAAMRRRALLWATEWSPPAAMKSNGNFETGGSFLGGANNFTSLAAIHASFVTLLTGQYGIPIYAISPQNEPELSENYPSCVWTAQQIHDYIPYLVTALSNAGYSSTKVMIAEPGTWVNTYAATTMDDAAEAGDISILASHGYFSNASLLSYSNVTTQHKWETEVSDLKSYDESITSGLTYATEIHDWIIHRTS
jgi:glucuronoarabinoxylan endo-1,4-beta-xylanase